jgi:hypothetical protein
MLLLLAAQMVCMMVAVVSSHLSRGGSATNHCSKLHISSNLRVNYLATAHHNEENLVALEKCSKTRQQLTSNFKPSSNNIKKKKTAHQEQPEQE